MTKDLRTERKGKLLAVKDLPTLPKVLEDVTKLVKDPDSSTEDIAKVIAKDQVLSAKVLKMVNSPIYGFPGRISSIQHALVLLGFNVIRGIIISTSVFDIIAEAMAGLWEHSLGCALACGTVARELDFSDPEEYSVSGLLHDLGKVVAAVQLPKLKEEIDAKVRDKDMTYLDAEREVLGFGHDRINAWLGQHWNLPINIREGMAHHHRPSGAQHYPDVAKVVHVGDFLVRLYEVGSGGDENVPYLELGVLRDLGINQQKLERILDTLGDELVEVADLDISEI